MCIGGFDVGDDSALPSIKGVMEVSTILLLGLLKSLMALWSSDVALASSLGSVSELLRMS